MRNKAEQLNYAAGLKAFFDTVPTAEWTEYKYFDTNTGAGDALGLLGARERNVSPEAMKAAYFFYEFNGNISDINDGFDSRYQQITPKLRINQALEDIIAILIA